MPGTVLGTGRSVKGVSPQARRRGAQNPPHTQMGIQAGHGRGAEEAGDGP